MCYNQIFQDTHLLGDFRRQKRHRERVLQHRTHRQQNKFQRQHALKDEPGMERQGLV